MRGVCIREIYSIIFILFSTVFYFYLVFFQFLIFSGFSVFLCSQQISSSKFAMRLMIDCSIRTQLLVAVLVIVPLILSSSTMYYILLVNALLLLLLLVSFFLEVLLLLIQLIEERFIFSRLFICILNTELIWFIMNCMCCLVQLLICYIANYNLTNYRLVLTIDILIHLNSTRNM